MASKLVPLSDKLVLRPIVQEEVLTSGIVIPDTAREKPNQGEVIAVGPGRFEKDKRVPMELKVGDKVLYGKYSGTEVTIDNEQLLILREADVLAVVS